MDSTRFDNMTRLLGAGVNRRKVLRGLIGGAGALAATGATRQFAGAQPDCRTYGETCQNNPGQGNNCCGHLVCTDDGPGNGECVCPGGLDYCASGDYCYTQMAGGCCTDSECSGGSCIQGSCQLCPPGEEYCASGDYCYSTGTGGCCTDAQCGDEFCIDRACNPCPSGVKYCAATESCYSPSTGECCPGTEDGCGPCFECVGNTCTRIEDCCISNDDCSELPCTSCEGGECTPYAEYCPEDGGYCYNHNMLDECCYDSECGEGRACVDRNCCPVGYDYCREGDYCYTDREGECCTSDQCPDGHVCTDKKCSECPDPEEYCEEGDYCYSKMTGECCTDDECGQGEECTDRHCCPVGYDYCPDGDYCYTERQGECCTDEHCPDGVCVNKKCQQCPTGQSYCEATKSCYDPATQCCTDSECGPCAYCSELNNTCFGECSQSQSCCHGECVENEIGCCQEFGDTCGVLEVSGAGGDDRQYDCCDGLLCCFGQSADVCGECCGDFDCNAAWGGVCNNFICEYPTCEGKWEACDADSDCCHGLKCYGGVCKHRKHHHHPHKPAKPSKPSEVTTLPATGSKSGKDDSSSALGVTLATGAAALLAAKYLRQNSDDEATEEA